MEIERGEFRFRIRSDCVEASLGPFDDPESELVLIVHLSRLPSLIAGLVAIRQRNETQTRRRK
jgi:hypothetical protein